jgi:alpha-glucosidase
MQLKWNLSYTPSKTSFTETWMPVVGEDKEVENTYNQLKIELQEKDGKQRLMNLVFRLYDDGVGFRYEVPEQANLKAFEIMSEETQFQLNPKADIWWTKADYDLYEHLYTKSKVSELETANTPVSIKTEKGTYLAIHEANLTDYSEMTLKQDASGLHCELVPWPDGVKVKTQAPMVTPWRTIQIADSAGGLIESNLVENLNEPLAIEDPSWIQPMKYTGIWWSVHLGFETFEAGPHHAATTEKSLAMIDHCVELGIKGLLIEGWNRGWELRGRRTDIPDHMGPTDDYDIEKVAAYAKEKGIELIMYHETFGNIPHFLNQIDEAYEFMKKLGIRYIKLGAAGKMYPPGMHRHGQYMVEYHRKVLKKGAEYGFMFNIHEPVKQTGVCRTYPNLLTQEGVRGMEYEAWSSGNPPNHTVTIPFTRGLAGATDFNPGIFDIKFESLKTKDYNWRVEKMPQYPKNPGPYVKTTLAKQLALKVIIYSPLEMSPDLPENYFGHPAFQFIRDVGIVWDESKVLNGEIGEYITMARKKKDSEEWYLGAASNEDERELSVALDFLDENRTYEAVIYADGADAHWDKNPTAYQINTKQVTSRDTLKIDLAAGGGQAISLKPIN